MVRTVQLPGLDALLAHVPLPGTAKADLIAMMSDAARRYHGIEHITTLWQRHQTNAGHGGLAFPRADCLIACAIAFHDCVYDGYRRDNEERSASVWWEMSETADMSEHDRTWVADTIRATRDHLAYCRVGPHTAQSTVDEQLRLWMLDLDLTPIGEAPDDFDRNALLLREEVPDLDDTVYEGGVRAFLERLLAAPAIYRSPVLAAIYEAPARCNIMRRLGRS